MLDEVEMEMSMDLVGGLTLKFRYTRSNGGGQLERILVTPAGDQVAPITVDQIKEQREDLRHVIEEVARLEGLPLG